MSPTETETAGITQRDKIDPKHTWNLRDIFEDDQAWEDEYAAVKKTIENARLFAGRLAESPRIMYDCLKSRDELNRRLLSLYHYTHLAKDLDNRVSRYQAMNERAAALSSQAGAAYAYVEPELLTIDEQELQQMAAKFENRNEFDFYISELIRSREHIRTEEIEELLANASMMARGPGNIFTMLDDADIIYPSITDEEGNQVTLTKQRYQKFMESSDRCVRSEAFHSFMQPYKQHLNSIAASLSSAVNTDIFYSRARRFDSTLHGALDGDNIPLSVYMSLLETTESEIDGFHSYQELRTKILGLDKLQPYDLYNPLFPARHFEVPYDEAVQKIMTAVKPLGEAYCQQLQLAFDSRWIDVYETDGKGSGAYSFGNYSVHPYVLMNYNNTVDSMFTLAHEMGHAMHSFLTSQKQPHSKSHYSTFVAEVASTLNEGLLLKLLLDEAEQTEDKLYLLNHYVDNTAGTFFRQIMYARFELMIHEGVEQGGALSPEMMNNWWGELTSKYYGPLLEVGELESLKWSRIPHFYNAYYVYQYATSYAASEAILARFLSGETGIVDKYLTLLSAGGSDHPIELLKKCGVDMSAPEPVQTTISKFADAVGEIDSLI